ncbi:cytochrome c oxidase assembly protein [Streptomyces sp. NPDC006385]|uniref:cytochrome c oxidase assembly protein n=1 Tax=Streptomyces sp. NPDC006385 TaxID=3156761 RepID=UPI0033B32132
MHAHLLAAGLLFTFAVCQLDPVRRRWSVAVRGATLLVAGAAHGVLAKTKTLYALPPPGTGPTAADPHSGPGGCTTAAMWWQRRRPWCWGRAGTPLGDEGARGGRGRGLGRRPR